MDRRIRSVAGICHFQSYPGLLPRIGSYSGQDFTRELRWEPAVASKAISDKVAENARSNAVRLLKGHASRPRPEMPEAPLGLLILGVLWFGRLVPDVGFGVAPTRKRQAVVCHRRLDASSSGMSPARTGAIVYSSA